ncbi:MAG: bacillithiol biosynthesis BshC, partial [Flavobacterium sp.]|nr:bacillithiol biosynthesis BshC [Flavobacterium sp.]
VLLATEKQAQKADKLELNWADLFSTQNDLLTNKTKSLSQFTIDFSEQKAYLQQQFVGLREMAKQTDKSFIGAVEAQEKKQLKGLENLEKRLLKAEKRVLAEKLERMTALQNELFPGKSLQERKVNFAVFYAAFGPRLIDKLLEELKPLEQEFNVIMM